MNTYKAPYHSDLKKLHNLKAGEAVDLVLSGGGEKGVAHLVLLEKLIEKKVKINSISACSAGSLVGSMFASGISTKDILKFFQETDIFQYTWLTFKKPGIFDSYNYANFLKGRIKPTFEELNIPLYVNATNMQKGYARYFNTGNLINPVLASCAIPGIFNPVEIDGELYSDGGVMDNFPLEPFRSSTLKVIGSFLSYPEQRTKKDLSSTLKVVNQATKLISLSNEEHKFHQTYLTVCFPVDQYSGYKKTDVDKIYEEATEHLKDF